MYRFFQCFDRDADGYITETDIDLLKTAYSTATGGARTDASATIQRMWTAFSQLGSHVELETAVNAIAQQRYLDAKISLTRTFRYNFNLNDINQDGSVDPTEFGGFRQLLGISAAPEDPQGSVTFQAADKNGNGKLSQTEYVDAWVNYFLSPVPYCPYLLGIYPTPSEAGSWPISIGTRG